MLNALRHCALSDFSSPAEGYGDCIRMALNTGHGLPCPKWHASAPACALLVATMTCAVSGFQLGKLGGLLLSTQQSIVSVGAWAPHLLPPLCSCCLPCHVRDQHKDAFCLALSKCHIEMSCMCCVLSRIQFTASSCSVCFMPSPVLASPVCCCDKACMGGAK